MRGQELGVELQVMMTVFSPSQVQCSYITCQAHCFPFTLIVLTLLALLAPDHVQWLEDPPTKEVHLVAVYTQKEFDDPEIVHINVSLQKSLTTLISADNISERNVH